MEILPRNTTSLDLSISMPGFSPQSLSSSGTAIKLLDINQAPSRSPEECMVEDDDDEENPNRYGYGSGPRKKLRLTKEQSQRLEENFLQNPTLNPDLSRRRKVLALQKEKEALAMELRLKARQVEVWFQNRRARSKMKQTEIECEYLKRRFGALSEQNRRLQKEVEELRSMKAVLPIGLQPPPPVSALTMCPRCERTTATATSEGKVRFLQRRRSSMNAP